MNVIKFLIDFFKTIINKKEFIIICLKKLGLTCTGPNNNNCKTCKTNYHLTSTAPNYCCESTCLTCFEIFFKFKPKKLIKILYR